MDREYRDLRREGRCLEGCFRRTRSDQDRGCSTTRKCSTEPSFTATSYLDFINRKIEAVRRSTESAPPPTFHQTDHRMPDLQPFSMDGLRQLLNIVLAAKIVRAGPPSTIPH